MARLSSGRSENLEENRTRNLRMDLPVRNYDDAELLQAIRMTPNRYARAYEPLPLGDDDEGMETEGGRMFWEMVLLGILLFFVGFLFGAVLF